jgi:hypothetical protein
MQMCIERLTIAMDTGYSKKAVYAALFGNLEIAIPKLAATVTGSTAIWAMVL